MKAMSVLSVTRYTLKQDGTASSNAPGKIRIRLHALNYDLHARLSANIYGLSISDR